MRFRMVISKVTSRIGFDSSAASSRRVRLLVTKQQCFYSQSGANEKKIACSFVRKVTPVEYIAYGFEAKKLPREK